MTFMAIRSVLGELVFGGVLMSAGAAFQASITETSLISITMFIGGVSFVGVAAWHLRGLLEGMRKSSEMGQLKIKQLEKEILDLRDKSGGKG